MKICWIAIACSVLPLTINAARYTWNATVSNGMVIDEQGHGLINTYSVNFLVWGADWPVNGCYADFLGYDDGKGLFLKQCLQGNFEPTREFQHIVLANAGDMITAESIKDSDCLAEGDFYTYTHEGGTLIPSKGDFYMAALLEPYQEGDPDMVGWLHLSVNENMVMTLVDSGINLDGGPIIVGGIGPTPEPTSAILVLFGLAALALRRRT